MCLVLSESVLHFDIALLWKFTNHDDFALTVRYRSFNSAYDRFESFFITDYRESRWERLNEEYIFTYHLR